MQRTPDRIGIGDHLGGPGAVALYPGTQLDVDRQQPAFPGLVDTDMHIAHQRLQLHIADPIRR